MTIHTISQAVSQTIVDAVSTWDGITVAPHRFGGVEFRVGDREIGHIHGSYQADIPFSSKLRKELVATGRASLHHLYPNSGWITFYIHSADDVPALIDLLRLNYNRLAHTRIETHPSVKVV
jgi:hypothetical protein